MKQEKGNVGKAPHSICDFLPLAAEWLQNKPADAEVDGNTNPQDCAHEGNKDSLSLLKCDQNTQHTPNTLPGCHRHIFSKQG